MMEILCENVLRVSGYHDDIVRFDERFRKGRKITERNYHFDHLYPTPHLNSDEALKWRKENWSVEDSFFTDSFSKDAILNSDMETYYYFDTPNAAPENLIKHVSAVFNELGFMLVFSPEGNRTGKIKEYLNGELISDEDLSDEDIAYWFGDRLEESA